MTRWRGDLEKAWRDLAAAEKQRSQMEERLNICAKRAPGRSRIEEIRRIASMLEIEADEIVLEVEHELLDGKSEYAEAMRADALILRRLAWDLETLRDACRPESAVPRGERP